jgi:carbon storage regulator CsrA
MLVLTRKYQEKIRIGDNITITVLRTKGKAVRLGIEAPGDVPVIRGELAFMPSADCESTSDGALEATKSSVAVSQTARCRRAMNATPTWATESPQRNSLAPISPPAAQVELKRIPRCKVASTLPELVSGSAPLRAMMERR